MPGRNRGSYRTAARSGLGEPPTARAWLYRAAWIFFSLGLFVWLENEFSHSFRECVANNAEKQATGNAEYGHQFVSIAIESKIICTGRFIDAHNGLFAVVMAAAVAWFTFTLWRSSEKLWAESRDQGRATRKALKLGRKEFEAAHRPWIAIKKIKAIDPIGFKGGSLLIRVEFTIENTGSAPATDLLPMHDSHPQNRMPPIRDIMGKLAAAYEAHKSNTYIQDALPSHTVMPGEIMTLNVDFVLDVQEFLRAPAVPNLVFFAPIMVGGFFYRSPLHKRDRCTGFTYAASLKDNWIELSEDGTSVPVPVRDVVIRRWQTGWTAT